MKAIVSRLVAVLFLITPCAWSGIKVGIHGEYSLPRVTLESTTFDFSGDIKPSIYAGYRVGFILFGLELGGHYDLKTFQYNAHHPQVQTSDMITTLKNAMLYVVKVDVPLHRGWSLDAIAGYKSLPLLYKAATAEYAVKTLGAEVGLGATYRLNDWIEGCVSVRSLRTTGRIREHYNARVEVTHPVTVSGGLKLLL